MSMIRVSKRQPCPICTKTDWCLIGTDLVLCMRSFSTRSKTMADGSMGYLHSINSNIKIDRKPEKKYAAPAINFGKLMWAFCKQTPPDRLNKFASEIGVTPESLATLRCGQRDANTWAFPMRDRNYNVVGIRLRTNDGKKFAVTGSKQGLFIPRVEAQDTVYLPEGPTDTAAAVSLGVFAIGRPSCNGGVYELIDALTHLKVKRAVIIADTDHDHERPDGSTFNPGIDGANLISEHMKIPSCVLALPCKDMRQFLNLGGDRATLEALTNQCVWRQPQQK